MNPKEQNMNRLKELDVNNIWTRKSGDMLVPTEGGEQLLELKQKYTSGVFDDDAPSFMQKGSHQFDVFKSDELERLIRRKRSALEQEARLPTDEIELERQAGMDEELSAFLAKDQPKQDAAPKLTHLGTVKLDKMSFS